ncbi:50S ribosomal protein L11 methyltransferase [Mariprofundus ferrooxydans]|nr:50S ribosomal protein L11 methyltransferase [Mariprofundus ferrooxydans]
MQATKSLELRLPTTTMAEDVFEQLAESLQTLGVAMEIDADSGQSSHIAWFAVDGGEAEKRRQIELALNQCNIDSRFVALTLLENEGWETAWQKDWHAMPVGKRLWVRPSFCLPPADDRIDVVLDPGMAFGTGTHATTQLCLEAIERVCSDHPPATLLDMGAGSGLLAIAALKLGAGSALAIDMETESVEACTANAAMNTVTLNAVLADTPPTGQFDLVVANILAAPLVWMAKELAACVSQRLILSGLLIDQVDDVALAYVDEGLIEVRRDSQGEWASVEFLIASK